MQLYGYYRSSTSYRIRIALGLKNLPVEHIYIDLKNRAHFTPDFEALNPHQSVPVLQAKGNTLTQSLAIIDWLEETYPSPSFLPENAKHIQFCKELYYAIATEVHALNNLAVLTYLKENFDASHHDLECWNARWIKRTFEPVHRRLCLHDWPASGFPFGGPGLFEIVLIPQIYNARRWNVDLSAFPRLLELDALCAEHDVFKQAHPDTQHDAPEK